MKFNVDHYFHIGHMHYAGGKPCQDHALSRSNGTYASVIVSDGCSTGGNTDVGSRVISCSTLQAISDHMGASPYSLETAAESIRFRQRQIVSGVRPILGLEHNDMFATCLYAYLSPFGGLLFVHGDGAIALKFRDGSICVGRYEWANNMPFYPAYEGKSLDAFINAQKNSEVPYALEMRTFDSAGNCIESRDKKYSVSDGVRGMQTILSLEQLAEIDYVAVFTDGVSQVDGVEWFDAIRGYLAYKNTAGEFCKRRMMRAIKDSQATGKGPEDDIACGVIRIEREEESHDGKNTE